jgi:hypothetical protein
MCTLFQVFTRPLGPTGSWNAIKGSNLAQSYNGVRVLPGTPSLAHVLMDDQANAYSATWLMELSTGNVVGAATSFPWPGNWAPYSMTLDPNNDDHLVLGNVVIYESLNGGQNYQSIQCANSPVCGQDYHELWFDPLSGDLFAGHDQGLFRRNAMSNAYTQIETSLNNTLVYEMGVDARGNLYAGTQDKGLMRREGLTGWEGTSITYVGDIFTCVVDPTASRKFFVKTFSDEFIRATDGGQTTTVHPSDRTGAWNNQIAYDPVSQTVYVSDTSVGVIKSIDDGLTIQTANGGLPASVELRALGMAAGQSQTVFGGDLNGNIYKTSNGGASWIEVDYTGPPVIALAVSPNNQTVLAGTPDGVWRSTNGGASWTPASGLPAGKSIGEVLFDAECPCLAYAGGGYVAGGEMEPSGVYESRDGGLTWNELSGPFSGSMVVSSIVIDPNSPSRLWLGTYGSGVAMLFRQPDLGGCSCP